MEIFNRIKLWWQYNIHARIYNWRMKRKYPDYEDNEYNCGSLKFIWGVKSWDDLCNADACFYTMNDIDISYDRDTKRYILGIETAYLFENKEAECKYLKDCLKVFTKFMDDHGYNKNVSYMFWMCNPGIEMSADSIEELYTGFRIFVEGYCKVYGGENE